MSDITYRYRDLIERIHVPDDYASEFEESAVDTGWLVEAVDSLSEAADLIEQLQARIAELEQDNATQHGLIMRQTEILTSAVNAAKGKPKSGLHSHHDLADVVAGLAQQNRELVAQIKRLREVVKSAVSVFSKYGDDVDAYPTLEHRAFMETLKEQCK